MSAGLAWLVLVGEERRRRKGIKDNEKISRKRMKRWKMHFLWTFLAVLSGTMSVTQLEAEILWRKTRS